jgi:hypothetical protein
VVWEQGTQLLSNVGVQTKEHRLFDSVENSTDRAPLRLRYTQHPYAQIKAKRSGEAERSRYGGAGGLPRLRYNTTRPRAQHAKRNGEGAFFRLQSDTTRHEATTRATLNSPIGLSSRFSALGTPAKPNRDVQCNALLCSYGNITPVIRL